MTITQRLFNREILIKPVHLCLKIKCSPVFCEIIAETPREPEEILILAHLKEIILKNLVPLLQNAHNQGVTQDFFN